MWLEAIAIVGREKAMNIFKTAHIDCPGGDRSRALSARRRRLAAGAATFAALALPVAAHAAAAPKASTGPTRDISYGSATLTGTVNPAGNNTSYYFQYGPTKAYGGQTAIADAGAGTSNVGVRLAITGLQPITVYHYRLVAVNAAGVATGVDRAFKTEKVPLSLAILASPNPVAFGGPVTIQGTLSGTSNANRAVVLQANAFPFTTGFQSIGNPELTIASENVAVRVSSHVARVKRRGFARIYGTVTPAVNGAQVGVLRIAKGHGILAGGTVAKPKNASSSQFSRVVRVSKGAYRVLVKVAPGAVVSAYGTPLLIR
jgi:hypothetical protein